MRLVVLTSLLVGIGSLAWGYESSGLTVGRGRWFALGVFWTLAYFRRMYWLGTIGFAIALAAAGYGVWTGLPIGWMMPGAIGALFAWDATNFEYRLRLAVPPVSDPEGLRRHHLLRMAILAGGALLISLGSMVYRGRFSPEGLGYVVLLAGLGGQRLLDAIRSGER